jgi:NAD(P)-dependent dehydrogenase (short-subunit alcohol dehydrogenase family)
MSALTPGDRIRLDGKVALVTGGSKGIGLATAAAMAQAGAAVMISSRKQEALDAAVATIDGDVAAYAANAGHPDEAEACVAATVARFGQLDILVNNAATNPHHGPTIGVDLGRFDKTMQVNLRGPLVWTQAVWKAGMNQRGGCVINVASIGGLQRPGSAIGVYNVSKAGLIHLTRVLASELGPGVRVNALAPGLVKTDFARVLWENAEEQVAAHLPMRRLGVPEDIAGAAVFLASDLASWITGQVLVVDGGATIS